MGRGVEITGLILIYNMVVRLTGFLHEQRCDIRYFKAFTSWTKASQLLCKHILLHHPFNFLFLKVKK